MTTMHPRLSWVTDTLRPAPSWLLVDCAVLRPAFEVLETLTLERELPVPRLVEDAEALPSLVEAPGARPWLRVTLPSDR